MTAAVAGRVWDQPQDRLTSGSGPVSLVRALRGFAGAALAMHRCGTARRTDCYGGGKPVAGVAAETVAALGGPKKLRVQAE